MMNATDGIECGVAEAAALGQRALSLATERGEAVLATCLVRGPAVVLGAAQRAGRVLDLAALDRDGVPVLRRTTSGASAWVGARAMWITLALPTVRALYPDGRSDTALNRNIRPLLKGLSKVGPVASYTGRDFVRASGRPVALAGLEVTRAGAVLIEVLAGVEASFELPTRYASEAERATARWASLRPMAWQELAPTTDPLRALAAVREAYGAVGTVAPDGGALEPVRDPWSPAERAVSAAVTRAVPIGVVEGVRVGCAGGTEAVWLGGDALCARWVYEEVARGRREGFGDDVPLLGARLGDLVAVAEELGR